MVTLIFQSPDGSQTGVEAAAGSNVMQVARDHNIEGIDADCGGSMVCGTCHCWVDPVWQSQLPEQSSMETDLLDYVPEPRPNTRLTCQLTVSEALDGITFYIPETQR